MNAVTEGIDAIATTRVVIRGDDRPTTTNASTGETVQRTFRSSPCSLLLIFNVSRSTMASSCICVYTDISIQFLSGSGAGMDIVVSSVRAYVSALNKMLAFKDLSASKAARKVS